MGSNLSVSWSLAKLRCWIEVSAVARSPIESAWCAMLSLQGRWSWRLVTSCLGLQLYGHSKVTCNNLINLDHVSKRDTKMAAGMKFYHDLCPTINPHGALALSVVYGTTTVKIKCHNPKGKKCFHGKIEKSH